MQNAAIQTLNANDTAERAPGDSVRRRIMHVTWSMVAGGAEVYALNILRNLDPARFSGAICASDQGGALEPEFSALGIPMQIMHRKPGIELSLIWRLYRLFRSHRIDVVHTHHFTQIFYSALAARMAGARLIHTEHSVELFNCWRRRLAMRLLCHLCSQVLVVGPEVKKFMQERVGIPQGKLRVVYAGVPIPRQIQTRAAARAELGFHSTAPIVLIVARLFPEKNHVLLLTAFKQVVVKIPNAQLLIAGEGTEEAAIRGLIARLGLGASVRMLGVRRDVPALLAAADVIALPSRREGLPLIVLEAMAAARPVVASRVGDIPDVITNGESGLLITPGDGDALASTLLELLTHPARGTEMGRRGRELAIARFDIRNMVAAHEALYA